ncbi:Glyco_trans_2-like domain-containing protein [Paraburkholderia caribensis]|uniref:methyltransferase domain-containing protein n=1 Tax=Paraburkholderia caribensis TaxID=75105 RepID=UPI001CAF2654|nr:methyltransferase domain-containing protein [Paraburkholderia caribensis]CAG9229015.1 Glyco_trans_2-like domain-containing protein [Paraburkholderia caribensis]
MATVSILIPAYKPQYLVRAIISAQHQTFTDIEILVGDDTPDGNLEGIVKGVSDARLHYFHHGFQKGTRNILALWERAKGKYIKFLFDDDILLPTSVETLVAGLRANPDSLLAFHERVFVDADDKVTSAPPRLLADGQIARIERGFLVQNMVGGMNNFIGEPSNVMLDRERFDPARLFEYRSQRLDYLGDVATYLNASEQAPIVAVGGYFSAFRRHAEQASNQFSPHISAGLYEWELIARSEAAAGHLSGAALEVVKRQLAQLYTHWAVPLPEIARFAANLDELVESNPLELLDSVQFQADLAHARKALTTRIAARRKAASASPAQKFCAVCETPVEGWIPHPEANSSRDFMQQMGAVGSTLENHLCPHCNCNDRERHLWLYLDRAQILKGIAQKRILHIAPEAGIERRVRTLAPLEYVAGDLSPQKPDHRAINVERIDYPDGYFDLIVCNHVLEHVDRPDTALAEFTRCLAPGGHLVAQTPYSPLLKHTFELNVFPSKPFATRYFGQGDHVRLFGSDLLSRIRAAGLNGDLYPHTTVLGDIDPNAWGCNEREPFFLFAKGPAPAFLN